MLLYRSLPPTFNILLNRERLYDSKLPCTKYPKNINTRRLMRLEISRSMDLKLKVNKMAPVT